MAQPTQRDYLIVSVAMLVLALGGSWLAVNWRRLAAAYYIHQAENLAAKPETVRRALEKAGRYDRKQLVAFWEREVAALNRIEAAAAKTEPGIRVTVTPRAGKYLIEEGTEWLYLDAVLRNETGQELRWPAHGFSSGLRYCDLSTWAKHRREPTAWETVLPLEPGLYGALYGTRSRFSPVPPGGEVREECSDGFTAPIIEFPAYPPPGFYRIRVYWSYEQNGERHEGVRWVVLRALPKPEQPDETWSLFTESDYLSPETAGWRLWRYYEKRSGTELHIVGPDDEQGNFEW